MLTQRTSGWQGGVAGHSLRSEKLTIAVSGGTLFWGLRSSQLVPGLMCEFLGCFLWWSWCCNLLEATWELDFEAHCRDRNGRR